MSSFEPLNNLIKWSTRVITFPLYRWGSSFKEVKIVCSRLERGRTQASFSLSLFFFFFFDVDHFKSLYWIWYNIASIYALIFWPWGMWDLYSPTRDQTCIPCIGWRSLNHWTTRKAPILLSYCEYFKLIILSLLLLIPPLPSCSAQFF